MPTIPTYRAEVLAGLADRVANSGRVTFAAAVQPARGPATARPGGLAPATASLDDGNLFLFDGIIVSTNVNKNDDAFLPSEVWAARRTPDHHPLNLAHDDHRVLGHLLNTVAVDSDYSPIADGTPADSLPELFHLRTTSCLYRTWKSEDLQQVVGEVINDIINGTYWLSMECALSSFDYGLLPADGPLKVIARNEGTAHMTRMLRHYGGQGQYQGQRLVRVLRGITFTATGLVKNPANDFSVIIPGQPQTVGAAIASYLGGDGPVWSTTTVPVRTTSLQKAVNHYFGCG